MKRVWSQVYLYYKDLFSYFPLFLVPCCTSHVLTITQHGPEPNFWSRFAFQNLFFKKTALFIHPLNVGQFLLDSTSQRTEDSYLRAFRREILASVLMLCRRLIGCCRGTALDFTQEASIAGLRNALTVFQTFLRLSRRLQGQFIETGHKLHSYKMSPNRHLTAV
jgi:hypothetical protein